MVCKLKLIKFFKKGYVYVSVLAIGALAYVFWTDGFKGFLELFTYMSIGFIVILVGEKLMK